MSINVFRLLFFHIQVAECALSVNTKSLFKLSSGFSNIFLIATAADNYINTVGIFAIEIRFQNKWLMPILKFKEFSLHNIITTKATFSAFCCFQFPFQQPSLVIFEFSKLFLVP